MMEIGDIVVRKSYKRDVTFRIIDIKKTAEGEICTLKGIKLRILADSPLNDLELVSESNVPEGEQAITKQVNDSIKKILIARNNENLEGSGRGLMRGYRSQSPIPANDELKFGRPGKILHIDGDAEYLNVCLKVYKQLSLEVVGKMIPEKDQPEQALELVKQVRPDIVVITGHDAVSKGTKDYMDISNYRNSRYYVSTVSTLRNYEANYDDLVIYAGACQSCYEAILDAGAYWTKMRLYGHWKFDYK